MTADRPIRVVVVEDSSLQRAQLIALLVEGGAIRVVGEAATVDEAVAVVERTRPDVVTMDLEIPGGRGGSVGGLLAIERISDRVAVPILVLSAHVGSARDTLAIEALAAGAVDVFPKAAAWEREGAADLRRRVAVLSRVPMVRRRRPQPVAPTASGASSWAGRTPVVGLVASTGGPSALRTVVAALAGVAAPILVVQHIHPDFAASFAEWLGHATGVPAALARDGERAALGHVHVAPGDLHLRLGQDGTLALSGEPELLARPSGDELLRSIAEHAGAAAIGAVLTGMGDDGAHGLLALRGRGGSTFAQDGETSVVDGMPRVAREIGAAERVLPLAELGPAIASVVARRRAGG